MKRIRAFFESIVFAGLKPGGQTAPKQQLRWLGPLRGPIERLLSGGPAPSDPLYLTNRTPAQKLKSWSLIAIPCVALALGVFMLSRHLHPPESKPVKELTAAEITARLLPNMDKDIQLPPAGAVQVIEIKVEGSRLVGVVKNTTTSEIAAAELVIELVDAAQSQVGAVNGTVEKIPPSGTKAFEIPMKQRNAAFALVRSVTTR